MILKRLKTGVFLTLSLATGAQLLSVAMSPDDGSMLVPSANAQKLTKKEKEQKLKYKNSVTQKRKSVGASCSKRLEKVQELTEAEDWSAAESELRGALKRGCKEGYEHSQINRYLGYVYYAQDKYKQAIAAYMAVVNEPEADPQQKTDIRYTVAQLMFVGEDYRGAVTQLEAWLKETPVVDRGGQVLLARGYYQLDRKSDAIKLVETVVDETLAEGLVPKEAWLSFQWALYYEKNQYKDTIAVSNLLLTHYPKVKYWKQISAMYGALENDKKEMLALEITHFQGGLDKEKQLIALGYQYLAFDIPYRAAQLIKKGMDDGVIERTEKNLEVLGSAYQRAQEYRKASPVLEEAAKKSDKGNAWSRLANVYLNLNENEKALVAARNALKKGGLKREDLTWMSRGSAEAALHCYKDAEKSFTKASKYKKTEKGAASWKKYVQNEGDRRSKLIATGAKLASCKKV